MGLVFKNFTTFKSPPGKFFKDILLLGLNELKVDDSRVEISVSLVGESKIRSLNKKYRAKDKITDVLSFPIDMIPDSRFTIRALGDIFICLPFAKKQAKRENVRVDDKLARLTVHGFLHLLGYDHKRSNKEAEKMFELENKILNKRTT